MKSETITTRFPTCRQNLNVLSVIGTRAQKFKDGIDELQDETTKPSCYIRGSTILITLDITKSFNFHIFRILIHIITWLTTAWHTIKRRFTVGLTTLRETPRAIERNKTYYPFDQQYHTYIYRLNKNMYCSCFQQFQCIGLNNNFFFCT